MTGGHLFEGPEDPFAMFDGNSRAVVGDDHDPVVVAARRIDPNLTPAVLAGVLEKIPEHLLDPVGIGMDSHVSIHGNGSGPFAAGRKRRSVILKAAG